MDQRAEPSVYHTAVKPSRRKSIIGSIIALVCLALLGWLAWHLTHPADSNGATGAGGPGGRRGPPATTVGVATVERADIPVVVEALGTVTASAVATVRPQVSGVLKEVLFTEGQTVRAGQHLATIDPRQFEMALLQASGQRQRDEAQLQNAKLLLERYKTLLEQDSIARQEVDTQAALVKQLEGTIAVDRAVEGVAKLNLGYTKIIAPIGGRVGLRAVDVGNLVSANDTNGIADITQVSPIDVEFSLPQDLVPELRSRLGDPGGLTVTVLDRNRQTVLDTGKFLALDNQVDTQTGTIRAKGRFENAKSMLFPSQFVNARLLLRTIQGAAVVPVSAVRHGSNGDFVYVLNAKERTVSLRTVKRGQAMADKMEIVSGLQPGEQVITEGADRLKDGAKVTLPTDRPRGAGGNRGPGERSGNGEGAAPAVQSPASPGSTQAAATEGGQARQPGERRRRNAEAPAQ
ncbi:efflux RND transporter periplasmic adaptor subunit [Noviherbaspirillum saxi]|uniref:Efflux RND transporter periplasmic adaptor subunit n=1 Tax=Noviherbaspirillum saxi TaxID=2320863 RepID=A0A3A3G7G9_9BURK|nr:efflux RND transporter periplasmic adaptor subunit [Noviherbaspirillum saxi]RJF96130.1 efflux RND transporter periplasmic adaptor subunit [Noviherbaspirillum saxi]